jgi:hypothetical protein
VTVTVHNGSDLPAGGAKRHRNVEWRGERNGDLYYEYERNVQRRLRQLTKARRYGYVHGDGYHREWSDLRARAEPRS